MIGAKGKPWGLFATMAFSYFYVCALFASLFGVFWLIYLDEKAYSTRLDIFDFFDLLPSKMAITMVFAQFVFSLVIAITVPIFVFLRKGISLKEYLSFKSVPSRQYSVWLLSIALFQFSIVVLAQFIKLDPFLDEKSMTMAFKELFKPDYTTSFLYFIFIVLAPVFEEIVFRGFLFKGLRESKAGKWGAIITTTVLFAVIHIFNAIPILVVGFLLGLAREKTGSIYVPIAMHMLNNSIACGLIYYIVHFG